MAEKTSETKLVRSLRVILSFLLAGITVLLSIAFCFNSDFLKREQVEKYFTDYAYVCALREDVVSYVESIYDRNGLSSENIENIIDYQSVKDVADKYAGFYIGGRIGYGEQDYAKQIETVCSSVREDIVLQVERTGQSNNSSAVDTIVKSIGDYFTNEVSIDGISKISAVFNVGTTVSYVVIGIGAFFFVFTVLILCFLGEKRQRYRSFRACAISFFTAGFYDICLAGIIVIISKVKNFDIYPIYLSDQFMRYFHGCIGLIIIAGFILLVIALAIASLTWIKKVKGKR